MHHFIPGEVRLYHEHVDRKARVSPSPIPQEQFDPQFPQPHVYNQGLSTWVAADDKPEELERGSILKIASWNLDWSSPDPTARASAALGYLRHTFGAVADHLVVMLQEVCQDLSRSF
ncbi:hypothetical protein ACQKWADRAFT_316946 [Trichoderma austrokoningii]